MRFGYQTDTMSEVGVNSVMLAAATPTELKAFEAAGSYTDASYSDVTRELVLNTVVGNLAEVGQITITDSAAGKHVISYNGVSMVGNTATLSEVRIDSGDMSVVEANTPSTFTHTKVLADREGVTVINNSGADIVVGFNANIATATPLGILIEDGAERDFAIVSGIKIYAESTGGGLVNVIEWK